MWRNPSAVSLAVERRGVSAVAIATVIVTALGAVDAMAGTDMVVLGTLTAGPGIAAASGRPRAVLAVGAYALFLINALSWWPDQIWGTPPAHALQRGLGGDDRDRLRHRRSDPGGATCSRAGGDPLAHARRRRHALRRRDRGRQPGRAADRLQRGSGTTVRRPRRGRRRHQHRGVQRRCHPGGGARSVSRRGSEPDHRGREGHPLRDRPQAPGRHRPGGLGRHLAHLRRARHGGRDLLGDPRHQRAEARRGTVAADPADGVARATRRRRRARLQQHPRRSSLSYTDFAERADRRTRGARRPGQGARWPANAPPT